LEANKSAAYPINNHDVFLRNSSVSLSLSLALFFLLWPFGSPEPSIFIDYSVNPGVTLFISVGDPEV
jgi:hypothetical protein